VSRLGSQRPGAEASDGAAAAAERDVDGEASAAAAAGRRMGDGVWVVSRSK
jgi:hypothetical protein